MKKIILATILSIALFGTAQAKTPTGSVKIQGTTYTKENYDLLKADVIGKVEKMKTKPLTWDDARKWTEVASLELKDCPITLKAGDNIVDVINARVKTGCPADASPVGGIVALVGLGGVGYGLYKASQNKKTA